MTYKIDLILHWLWTLTYGILVITGFALMGAKYGWIMNYDLALADYLHRVVAAIWTVLLAIAVLVEIYQVITKQKKYSFWLIVGPKDYQLFTFISGIIFIVSGLLIWEHHSIPMAAFGFSLWIHEILTFIGLASVIWHLYDKAHALLIE